MKRVITRLTICILVIAMMVSAADNTTVLADSPYKTYTYDGYGYVNETQTAYMPYESITKVGDETFSGANDMVIANDGNLYIADSGNSRILVSDLEGNLINIIGEGLLVNPCGVYVTDNGNVYVADRDAQAVFVFSNDGELLKKYIRPDHPLYGDGLDFKPLKIVVNSAGKMFVVCEGNTNGIVQLSPIEEQGSETEDGIHATFLGYFGTNYASRSIIYIIQNLIYNDAQRAKRRSNMPSTPDNLSIDEKGLIYTVTRGEEADTLKKLNIAGKNMIEPDAYDDYPAAVATGNYENIFVVSSWGYIYEYNSDGELLFMFGGSDDGRQRVGLVKTVTAIDVDKNDKIYILDIAMNQIHVFEPTEFTNLLHEALYDYSKGRYTESKAPLTEVLTMNSLFDYANKAMGRAYLQEEDYDNALVYAKLAKDEVTYSDAFWELRNVWIQDNLVLMLGIAFVLWLLVVILKKLQKKHGIFNGIKAINEKIGSKTLIKQLKYSTYFMKHPIDGCYGVKRENKASLLCANIQLAAFIIVYVISKYFRGFLFKTVREGRYDIFSDIGYIVLIFLFMTICCYLIAAINDGEGKFKELYCAFAYSLTPYTLITPILIIVSHALSINEAFIYQFSNTIIITYIVLLLFLAVKEINGYSVAATIKVILITFFAALIGLLVIFILYVLWSQMFDFVASIVGEVVYRLGF